MKQSSENPASRFIGRYKVRGKLGAGAMGTVYRCYDPLLEREVAIKVIDVPGGPDAIETIQRFRREAVALGRLDHPNLLQIHDLGAEGEKPYLVLPYLSGQPLDQVLAERSVPPAEAARILRDLARGLECAHQAGLVHRDLKPANVILDQTGLAILTDFGLAVLSDESIEPEAELAGSPAYMAPEQVAGVPHEIGPKTDIYGLGALLHHLLTGKPPTQKAKAHQIFFEIAYGKTVDPRSITPNLDANLAAICRKCLSKDPAGRYASMAELAEDLDRYLEGPRGVSRLVDRFRRQFRGPWSKVG